MRKLIVGLLILSLAACSNSGSEFVAKSVVTTDPTLSPQNPMRIKPIKPGASTIEMGYLTTANTSVRKDPSTGLLTLEADLILKNAQSQILHERRVTLTGTIQPTGKATLVPDADRSGEPAVRARVTCMSALNPADCDEAIIDIFVKDDKTIHATQVLADLRQNTPPTSFAPSHVPEPTEKVDTESPADYEQEGDEHGTIQSETEYPKEGGVAIPEEKAAPVKPVEEKPEVKKPDVRTTPKTDRLPAPATTTPVTPPATRTPVKPEPKTEVTPPAAKTPVTPPATKTPVKPDPKAEVTPPATKPVEKPPVKPVAPAVVPPKKGNADHPQKDEVAPLPTPKPAPTPEVEDDEAEETEGVDSEDRPSIFVGTLYEGADDLFQELPSGPVTKPDDKKPKPDEKKPAPAQKPDISVNLPEDVPVPLPDPRQSNPPAKKEEETKIPPQPSPPISRTERPKNQAQGSASGGTLLNASSLKDELKSSSPFRILREERLRHFGTYELVEVIQYVAAYSKKLPISGTLRVGDLSQKAGGKLKNSRHKSHQNGLDVDLGYPVVDSLKSIGFFSMVSGGKVKDGMSIPETWALFKTAWASKTVDRIFVDRAIKRALCEHARKKGELDANGKGSAAELLRRLRPEGGHDTHFHLRIRCSVHHPHCRMMGDPPYGSGC